MPTACFSPKTIPSISCTPEFTVAKLPTALPGVLAAVNLVSEYSYTNEDFSLPWSPAIYTFDDTGDTAGREGGDICEADTDIGGSTYTVISWLRSAQELQGDREWVLLELSCNLEGGSVGITKGPASIPSTPEPFLVPPTTTLAPVSKLRVSSPLNGILKASSGVLSVRRPNFDCPQGYRLYYANEGGQWVMSWVCDEESSSSSGSGGSGGSDISSATCQELRDLLADIRIVDRYTHQEVGTLDLYQPAELAVEIELRWFGAATLRAGSVLTRLTADFGGRYLNVNFDDIGVPTVGAATAYIALPGADMQGDYGMTGGGETVDYVYIPFSYLDENACEDHPFTADFRLTAVSCSAVRAGTEFTVTCDTPTSSVTCQDLKNLTASLCLVDRYTHAKVTNIDIEEPQTLSVEIQAQWAGKNLLKAGAVSAQLATDAENALQVAFGAYSTPLPVPASTQVVFPSGDLPVGDSTDYTYVDIEYADTFLCALHPITTEMQLTVPDCLWMQAEVDLTVDCEEEEPGSSSVTSTGGCILCDPRDPPLVFEGFDGIYGNVSCTSDGKIYLGVGYEEETSGGILCSDGEPLVTIQATSPLTGAAECTTDGGIVLTVGLDSNALCAIVNSCLSTWLANNTTECEE